MRLLSCFESPTFAKGLGEGQPIFHCGRRGYILRDNKMSVYGLVYRFVIVRPRACWAGYSPLADAPAHTRAELK